MEWVTGKPSRKKKNYHAKLQQKLEYLILESFCQNLEDQVHKPCWDHITVCHIQVTYEHVKVLGIWIPEHCITVSYQIMCYEPQNNLFTQVLMQKKNSGSVENVFYLKESFWTHLGWITNLWKKNLLVVLRSEFYNLFSSYSNQDRKDFIWFAYYWQHNPKSELEFALFMFVLCSFTKCLSNDVTVLVLWNLRRRSFMILKVYL